MLWSNYIHSFPHQHLFISLFQILRRKHTACHESTKTSVPKTFLWPKSYSFCSDCDKALTLEKKKNSWCFFNLFNIRLQLCAVSAVQVYANELLLWGRWCIRLEGLHIHYKRISNITCKPEICLSDYKHIILNDIYDFKLEFVKLEMHYMG